MHGPNIWPAAPASLRPLVTEWMATMESLAQRVLSMMAVGLGLTADFFRNGSHCGSHTAVPDLSLSTSPARCRRSLGSRRAQRLRLLTLLAHDGTAACR
jgi:isopenicillin N synthase-like dioxygenase